MTTDTKLDVHAVLKRADHRYASRNGDDDASPEYIDTLVQAVQPLVAPAVDTTELQRLQDLVDELRRQVEAGTRTFERQKGEISALRMERDQLRDAPAHDPAETRRQVERAVAAGKAEADQLRARIDELRIDLAAAKKNLAEAVNEAETWQREYERIRDDTIDEIVERAHPPHEHTYPIDGTTGEIGPCSCSLIYPRYTLAAHQAAADEQPDEDEPISVLLERVRLELDKANWGKP